MNRTADALVADYRTARTLWLMKGDMEARENMDRIKAAVAIIWPGLAWDLDLAADTLIKEGR